MQTLILTYEPEGRADRREVFEHRPGPGDWLRREEVQDHTGGWREVGSEVVESIAVSAE